MATMEQYEQEQQKAKEARKGWFAQPGTKKWDELTDEILDVVIKELMILELGRIATKGSSVELIVAEEHKRIISTVRRNFLIWALEDADTRHPGTGMLEKVRSVFAESDALIAEATRKGIERMKKGGGK